MKFSYEAIDKIGRRNISVYFDDLRYIDEYETEREKENHAQFLMTFVRSLKKEGSLHPMQSFSFYRRFNFDEIRIWVGENMVSRIMFPWPHLGPYAFVFLKDTLPMAGTLEEIALFMQTGGTSEDEWTCPVCDVTSYCTPETHFCGALSENVFRMELRLGFPSPENLFGDFHCLIGELPEKAQGILPALQACLPAINIDRQYVVFRHLANHSLEFVVSARAAGGVQYEVKLPEHGANSLIQVTDCRGATTRPDPIPCETYAEVMALLQKWESQ